MKHPKLRGYTRGFWESVDIPCWECGSDSYVAFMVRFPSATVHRRLYAASVPIRRCKNCGKYFAAWRWRGWTESSGMMTEKEALDRLLLWLFRGNGEIAYAEEPELKRLLLEAM